MKTLDEVLEAMTNEICLNSKADCWEVPVDLYGVIVHYLHEYRSDKIKWEADRKSYQGFVDSYIKSRDKHQAAVIELKHKEKEVNDILTDYVALKQYWAEQQENPPLTWDELRQMEGQPVWVEYDIEHEDRTLRTWAIVFTVLDENMSLACSAIKFGVKKSEIGQRWQAYRKERE